MKPTPPQLQLLATATEAPDRTLTTNPQTSAHYGHVTYRTAKACASRGWGTIPLYYNDHVWTFVATDEGAELAKDEVARRAEARAAEQARLRAEDEALEAKHRAERAAEDAQRALEPHRRPFVGARSEPAFFATELQADDVKNEVAKLFLDALDGGPAPGRPNAALLAAFEVAVALFDEAVHVWLPVDFERNDFPEVGTLLRTTPPIRTRADAAAFDLLAARIATEAARLGAKTDDRHLAISACHSLHRLVTTCHRFGNCDAWNLAVVAKTLGEVARQTGQENAARGALLRAMLPSAPPALCVRCIEQDHPRKLEALLVWLPDEQGRPLCDWHSTCNGV